MTQKSPSHKPHEDLVKPHEDLVKFERHPVEPLGGTHMKGSGRFPNLPLARESTLHTVFPELNTTEMAPEGEIISVEWPAHAGIGRKVALRRYHSPLNASETEVLQAWAAAVKQKARPGLVQELHRVVVSTGGGESPQEPLLAGAAGGEVVAAAGDVGDEQRRQIDDECA